MNPGLSSSPAAVVQRQLEAYNAHDLDALMNTYAEDARLFEHPATLLAAGAAQLRERFEVRLREPNLHAHLLKRIVMGNTVIDHERVTRTFPEGAGSLELIATYEVMGGKIVAATFLTGAKSVDSAAPGSGETPGEMQIRGYGPADEAAVIELWRRCGLLAPQNNPRADIERKLRVDPDLFLLGTLDGVIVASAMAGYEGHRGWINYLATAPEYRRRGYARQITARAEELLRARGCPKINLQVRTRNTGVIDFYQRIGFTLDDVCSLGKRLIKDEAYSHAERH